MLPGQRLQGPRGGSLRSACTSSHSFWTLDRPFRAMLSAVQGDGWPKQTFRADFPSLTNVLAVAQCPHPARADTAARAWRRRECFTAGGRRREDCVRFHQLRALPQHPAAPVRAHRSRKTGAAVVMRGDADMLAAASMLIMNDPGRLMRASWRSQAPLGCETLVAPAPASRVAACRRAKDKIFHRPADTPVVAMSACSRHGSRGCCSGFKRLACWPASPGRVAR